MRTMKTLLAATVLGTSALLLTACGGDDTAKEAYQVGGKHNLTNLRNSQC